MPQPKIEFDHTHIQPAGGNHDADWEAPRHVFFGKKDHATGKMAKEPQYVHQDYPRAMYRLREDGVIESTLVKGEDDEGALSAEWKRTPHGMGGYIGAPSLEEYAEMVRKDREAVQPKRKAA